jgi:hypothetical protein
MEGRTKLFWERFLVQVPVILAPLLHIIFKMSIIKSLTIAILVFIGVSVPILIVINPGPSAKRFVDGLKRHLS